MPAIKGMWCIPKYTNPTGAVYADAVIERLAAMPTAAPDFRIFWDNAYAVHHLTDERIEIAEHRRRLCARQGMPNRPSCSGRRRRSRWPAPASRCSRRRQATSRGTSKRMGKRTIGSDKVNQLRHVRFFGDHRTGCSRRWTRTAR